MAQSVVPTHTIRAGEVLSVDDVRILDSPQPGPISDIALVVGLEARRILYAGRPVRKSDLGSPALIERNQVVTIIFRTRFLNIETEGRALERGASGDVLRVLNLKSRNTVFGRVNDGGAVVISH